MKTEYKTSGERLAGTLDESIKNNQVNYIRVYRFHDSKLFNESSAFSVGHEFLDVGGQYYNLNKLVTYQLEGQALRLYF